MADPQQAAPQQAAATTTEKGLLDSIVDEGRLGKDETARERGKDLIKQFVKEVLAGTITIARDTDAMINARIAQIDHLISLQLNEVMHAPEFQKLEGTWRDLQRAPEFDQSALFKKVYEEEFGVFGGSPFGALIGDYEFGKSGQDIELLEKVSQVAAASHAPFLTAASPEMFNLESYTEIDAPRDMSRVFDTTEYSKWKGFRQSEDSRYVGLTCPRILMRLPYGANTVPVEEFNYEEKVDGTDHNKYLWANSSWALGARLTHAFAEYGWCACIRGVESGGMVEGLPVHNFQTGEGDIAMKCPTEVPVTDRREKELADLGFVPLVHCKDTDYAAFFSVQSAQKPKVYDTDSANANARLSTQIPYLMAVSRFAHYLKAMMRDKIGSFMSREEAERFLNRWITKYVVPDDTASMEAKARAPLREARIDVSEIPGKPGVYRAVAFLRPH